MKSEILNRSVFLRAFLALTIMTLGLLGCERSDQTQEQASLRLKWVTTAGFAGDYVAKYYGLFSKEGLDVEVLTGGPQAQPLVLVASGTNDFGVAGADSVLLARANGVPVIAIAAAFQKNASGFFTKKNSGIQEPMDWRGKKVGVIPGNDTETVYRALLAKVGLNRDEVSEVPIGFDLGPFLTGQVDVQPGYITNQPNILRAKGIEVNIINPVEYGVSMLGNVYFTTEQMVRNHPEKVGKFVRAVIAGWRYAVENPEAAIDALLAADPKLDRESQMAVLRATIPYVLPEDGKLGHMDPQAWEETRDTLLASGVMKKKIDVEGAYTNAFIRGVAG